MQEKKTNPPKKPRRWWKRLLWACVVMVVLVVIFHRWIFFGLIQTGVRYAEKAGHLQITYQLEGSIFNSLELSNLRVRVIEPGPLEKLTLKRLALRYHPWDGWRKGLPALVESVELRDLDLILDATKFPPRQPKKKKANKSSVAIPFPRLVDLRGVRVRINTPAGLLDVDQGNLTLLPDQAGVLSVNRLIIPKYRTFENIHGETSYANRDLVLQNFAIAENLVIERLQVDASRIGEQQLTAQLVAQAFTGTLAADFSLANMSQTGDMMLSATLQSIDLTQFAKFFQPTTQLSGKLDVLHLRIDGEAADLSTWNGYVQSKASKPTFGTMGFDTGSVNATLAMGQLKIENTVFLKSSQWVALSGTAQLPGKKLNAQPFLARLNLSADLPDLSGLVPNSTGSAKLDASLRASPNRIAVRANSDLTALGINDLTIDTAKATVQFTKTSQKVIDWKQPWWTNTMVSTGVWTTAIHVNGYQIDRVAAVFKSTYEKANIEMLEIVRGQNSVRSGGTFTFQEKPAGPLPGILALTLNLECPALKEFSIDPETSLIEGRAQGTATLRWETPNPVADLQIHASDLLHQGVKLGELTLSAHVENGLAQLTNFNLDIPGKSFIQATGEFDLQKQDRYAGQVSTRLTDLSQFKPLLGKALADTPLGGTLELDWNGTGQLKERLHEGRVSLFAKDGLYAAVKGIGLRTAGYYTPLEAEFPEINLTTSKGNLTTTLSYRDHVLKIDGLKLTQANELRLAGNVAFPLDLEQIANSEKRFPLDAPIEINLTGKDVQIGGLLVDLGMVPPVTGKISLDARAQGTLRKLDANIALKIDDLKTENAKQIQPVSSQINVAISNQRAQLSGTIREPSIQPITLSGNVPLDLASIVSTGTISPDLPLSAKASLPPTALAFLNRYTTLVDDIQGTTGFDVSMEGTLAKPRFLGGVKTNIKSIRFRGNNLPTIRNVDVDMAFRDNVLNIGQFKGDLAGGPFTIQGKIDLTKPAEPILAIDLKGQSILIVRNDTVVVRTDLDLALKGPLKTAEITGNIGIVDSRFFREIDILPINLPGRPAPAIQAKRPNVSITTAPVRDWKFNVNIKTVDTFKISGNLANGEVIVGLNLAGTGLAPTLDGNVQISQLQASLPFSRLNISDGNIYFSKDLPPLNPILDLQGSSRVRDYDISAYIWGDLVHPQTLFLSQPPLSQEDILTLLATGVTQSEIADNPQLLAGRAGYLFIQKYYNKIFKKKRGFEQESLADRFDLQLGSIDPKTGRENVSARLKLADRWQAIFDLDLTGGARGQVRYLIRFK